MTSKSELAEEFSGLNIAASRLAPPHLLPVRLGGEHGLGVIHDSQACGGKDTAGCDEQRRVRLKAWTFKMWKYSFDVLEKISRSREVQGKGGVFRDTL